MPFNHLTYHTVWKYKRFFAACGVIRGPGYSTYEIFDVARGKKRASSSFHFKSSKNFSLTYFQKLMWLYLLATKDSLLRKVWGKTFFSHAKCPRPLLQRSPLKGDIWKLNSRINGLVCYKAAVVSLPSKNWKNPILEFKQTYST